MATEKLTNKSYFELLKSTLAGGFHYNFNTSGVETPRFFEKGKDSYLWDIEGNKYLDFNCKFGVMIFGHSNSNFNQSLITQINKVLCANQTDLDLNACNTLKQYFPSFEKVRFGLSGTEIIQNALRLSRAYNGKTKFLRFEGHYHGNMDNIMGGRYSDNVPPIPIDNKNDATFTKGRVPNIFENECYMIPWNDIYLLEKTLKSHSQEISALIMEPVLINGGGILPKKGYLQSVRELCTKYKVVLIFDEIITGLRFGLSGAQGFYNVMPDLTVMGKSIGGGIPVSLLGGKNEIMKLYETREVVHGGTYNGHPLGMAAINSVFKILNHQFPSYYSDAQNYGKAIKSFMENTASEFGLELNVIILGSTLVFNACKKPFEQTSELTSDIILKNSIIFDKLSKNGILLCPTNRMFLNASFNDDDLNFFKEKSYLAIKSASNLINKIFTRNLSSYIKAGF
jgi:glutamate-1-semialdehyde 2,1-aminomutase